MKFSPLSDSATKQAIDATRAFKESLRVRRRLDELGGSMFWKTVGDYEYLAQRAGRKVVHIGVRSTETEQQFAAFQLERERLQTREKALRERIRLHERMNKAVRAGTTPTPVIDTLTLLEDLGLGTDSTWLGSSALHAYWQSSGLEPPKELTGQKSASAYLVAINEKLSARAKLALQRCKALDVMLVNARHVTVLIVAHKTQTALPHGDSDLEAITARLQRMDKNALEQLLKGVLSYTAFEQVVIGKTGEMGEMRTLDPQLFISMSRSPTGEILGLHLKESDLVQDLVEMHRVQTKLTVEEQARLQELS